MSSRVKPQSVPPIAFYVFAYIGFAGTCVMIVGGLLLLPLKVIAYEFDFNLPIALASFFGPATVFWFHYWLVQDQISISGTFRSHFAVRFQNNFDKNVLILTTIAVLAVSVFWVDYCLAHLRLSIFGIMWVPALCASIYSVITLWRVLRFNATAQKPNTKIIS